MNYIADSSRERRGHRARKTSGIEWLGEVPRHWDLLRLKYCADLVNEKVNGTACELPYTGLEHIESWSGKRLATDAGASSDGQASLHRAGDVLFGKLRPYLAKAYAAESDGICTSELLVLRPKALLQRFLRDYLLNPSFISVVDSSTYGAKMPRASWDFIGSLPVLVPPLDQQRAIAAFLDRETARIDALIEKKRRQIELLDEKRAALISHAVTKGLDPDTPMKESGIDWLGQVPVHWPIIRIGLLCSVGNGSTPSRENPEYWSDGAYPWLTSAKINEEVIEAADEAVSEIAFRECHLPWVRPESVLLAITGEGQTRGRAALLRSASTISQHLAYISPRSARLRASFLWRALQSQYEWLRLESSGVGSTRAALTCEFIRTIKIPLPRLDEQEAVTAFMEREAHKIDLLAAKVNLSIDRLREYRTALISAAVTGKLDVRQDVAP